jgi:hypothetical protein
VVDMVADRSRRAGSDRDASGSKITEDTMMESATRSNSSATSACGSSSMTSARATLARLLPVILLDVL